MAKRVYRTFEDILKFARDNGCKILTKKKDFIGSIRKIKLKFLCGKCREEGEKSCESFLRKPMCNLCALVKPSDIRFTFKDLLKLAKDNGCEILIKEEDFKDDKNKLKIKFVCGQCDKEDEKTYRSFIKNPMCIKCAGKQQDNLKYTFEDILEMAKVGGSTIHTKRENYKGLNTVLNFTCGYCDEISEKGTRSFIKYPICLYCGNEKRHSYEYIKKYFSDEGYVLISETYESYYGKLLYICDCGEVKETSYGVFRTGCRCWECGVELARISKTKYTIEFVKKTFEENNCELLTTSYINTRELLDYICECGDQNKISFSNFLMGRRCYLCGVEKREKSLFRMKPYTMPSGKIVYYQGYENFHIDVLLEQGYKEEDISIGRREILPQKYISPKDNREHEYNPDIWIAKENKYIEVKSTYTFTLTPNVNWAKWDAIWKLGFDMEIYIYEKDGELVQFIIYPDQKFNK